jgi:hypothetical protein
MAQKIAIRSEDSHYIQLGDAPQVEGVRVRAWMALLAD